MGLLRPGGGESEWALGETGRCSPVVTVAWPQRGRWARGPAQSQPGRGSLGRALRAGTGRDQHPPRPPARLPDPPRPADPSSQLCLQLRLPPGSAGAGDLCPHWETSQAWPRRVQLGGLCHPARPTGVPCRAVSGLPSHTGYCGHGEGFVPSTSRKRSVPATAPGPFPGQPGQDRAEGDRERAAPGMALTVPGTGEIWPGLGGWETGPPQSRKAPCRSCGKGPGGGRRRGAGGGRCLSPVT